MGVPQILLFVKKSVKVHVLTDFSPFFRKTSFQKEFLGEPVKLTQLSYKEKCV